MVKIHTPFLTCAKPMQIATDILQQCRFLAGPTACGKTDTGLLLAERLNAEILSLDSMALYRGLDIGTAKPTREQRHRVPHHLLDIIAPHEEFSVAEFLVAAERACRDILERGRVPLFIGGTGLYLRSLLRGVFSGPPADWEFRHRLERESADQPPDFLHRQLAQHDPVAAAKLHPHDSRRIIRALEVLHITGRKLSEQQQHPPLPVDQRPQHVNWLNPPRQWLRDRINRRVLTMIDDGLVEEVRRLLVVQPPLGRTARQALGYKEMIDHLEVGVPLAKTIDCIQTRTRQFAKRQCTWFRNLEECHAVEMTGKESPEELADRVHAE